MKKTAFVVDSLNNFNLLVGNILIAMVGSLGENTLHGGMYATIIGGNFGCAGTFHDLWCGYSALATVKSFACRPVVILANMETPMQRTAHFV